MGLSHIAIRAIDLKKSVDFYTNELGLKIVEQVTPIPGETIVRLADKETGQKLVIMHYSEDCKAYTPYKMDGVELDHIMFEVNDARKVYEDLVKNGVPVATAIMEFERPEGMFTTGFVKDPNGIWIGFRSVVEKKKKDNKKGTAEKMERTP